MYPPDLLITQSVQAALGLLWGRGQVQFHVALHGSNGAPIQLSQLKDVSARLDPALKLWDVFNLSRRTSVY